MKRSLNLLIGLIWMGTVVGQAQPIKTIVIGNEQEWSLSNRAGLLITPQNLTPEQAFAAVRTQKLTPVTSSYLNLGYEPNFCWLHLRMKNDETSKRILFTFDRPDVHRFECFRKRGAIIDTLALTGDSRPFRRRPIQINYFAIPIDLAPGEAIEILVLIEKKDEQIGGYFSLVSTEQFIQQARIEFGSMMAFLGILSFIFLFNYFLWLSLKDSVHLLFMGEVAANALFAITNLGYGFEFLWPNTIYRNSTFFGLMASVLAASILFLLNKFLSLTPSISRFYIANRLVGWFLLISTLIKFVYCLLVTYPLASSILYGGLLFGEITLAITFALLVATLIEQLRKNNPLARLFALATFFLLVGLLLSFLSRSGVIASGNFSTGWIIPGYLLQQVVLAFGLTLRYNRFKQQNLTLQLSLAETRNEANARIIQIQETERQRLAADLHDDLGGTLATIRRRLSDIRQRLRDPEAAREIDNLEPLIQKSGQDLRRIAHNLMPPEFERIGLRAALQQFVESQPNQSTRFSFIVAGAERKLSLDTELNVYRIVSELVQNIHRHAQARRAAVQMLYYDDHLSLMVEDDGVGSKGVKNEEQKVGIGLKTSSLRAEYIGATLWREASESGTFVMLDVPYQSPPNATARTNPYPAH